MLNLFRRHTKKCPNDSRDSLKCKCPVWIDWTTEGRRIRKPLGIRDWQAAQRRAREIESDGLAVNKSTVTVEKALQDFEIELMTTRKLRPSTMRKYEYFLRKLREFCKTRGLVFLNQLGVEEMRTFRAGWTFGPRSNLKQLERLKSFFLFCVESEWLDASPVRTFKPPKLDEEKEVVAFTEAEVVKILEACDKYVGNQQRLRTLINLMLASGLRIGDAVMVSRDKITRSAKGEYSLTVRTEKTGTRVTCPLPDAVAEQLLA